MQAVSAHADASDDSGQKEAGMMASLLSESVKISISLSQAMNLKADDGNADAIRVALAALAGGLVADAYRQGGRAPSDAESRKITKALEAVIVFADNFAPAAEHAQRLQTLDGVPPFFDPVQTNIYSIHALLPALAAISEFSFGQADTRLIQDVSEKLGVRAKALKNDLSIGGDVMSELVILQALGQIYASAHRAETVRLRGQGEDGNATIEAVWQAFDKQIAMLEVLLGSMTGTPGSTGQSGSGGGVKPDASPVAVAPDVSPPSPPPATEAPSATPPPGGGNPMSFFKKK